MHRNTIIFISALAFLVLVLFLLRPPKSADTPVVPVSTHSHEDGTTHTH